MLRTFGESRMMRTVTFLLLFLSLIMVAVGPAYASEGTGVLTANGWYEGEEIYYLLQGVEALSKEMWLNLSQVKPGIHRTGMLMWFIPLLE